VQDAEQDDKHGRFLQRGDVKVDKIKSSQKGEERSWPEGFLHRSQTVKFVADAKERDEARKPFVDA